MVNIQDGREERGRQIAQIEGAVERVDAYNYRVKSQSGNGWYALIAFKSSWLCSCPDFVFRGVKCKHIWAVEFSQKLREVVENQIEIVIAPISVQACPFCKSGKIIKKNIRHNKSGDIQRYLCKSCGRWFSFNLGFERMKSSPEVITSAMQLYFSGESFRSIKKFLKLKGVKVSHVAIYGWICKYVKLMEGYLDKITPQVSDTWRADEMYVKIKGNMKLLYALMDDETRFWIAQQVANTKYTEDVRPLLREARERAQKKPETFITDGAANFHDAYLKEFWTSRLPRTEHVQHIRLQGDVQNNKMERLNGETRDREKVMRGLKREDTPILKGYQIYHNYFRPHMALEGKTPAEKAGIKIEGENPWVTVIQNASHDQRAE
jgi:transposase-like protein